MQIFLRLFLILLLVSCSKDYGTNSENESDVIMPLKVGNSWKFNNNNELKVFATTTVNGKEAFIMKLYESDGHVDDLGIYANLADGLYMKEGDSLRLWLKYPGTSGEKYNINGNSFWKILTTSKNVSVKAGNFSGCYEYIYYDEGSPVENLIFKPNVGPIILGNGIELVSYSLK